MKSPGHLPIEVRARQQTASRRSGFSLMEMIVAVAIASMVLVVLGLLSLNGLQSFLLIGNSTALDARSRLAADQITRELRQAAGVVQYEVDAESRTLVLTNRLEGSLVQFTWSAADRTLTCEKSGQPAVTCLTDCDSWSAEFFQNQPLPSVTQPYLPATNGVGQPDLEQARIVSLSWVCSSPVLGSKIKTQSAQSIMVALRNTVSP